MKSRSATVLILSALAVFTGCKKNTVTQGDEIRTAIKAHLARRGTLNLQSFDMDVKQVSVQGDRAQARVEYRVKNGLGMMQLTYALEKRGGSWAIVESNPVGSDFSHPALDSGQSPAMGGQAGDSTALFDALRNFKTGNGTSSQTPPPPGHPPGREVPKPAHQKTP